MAEGDVLPCNIKVVNNSLFGLPLLLDDEELCFRSLPLPLDNGDFGSKTFSPHDF
jgi:hypothetical protein